MIKTKFLQASIGVSIILFSLGIFFHSIQTARASPTPAKFLQSGANNIVKYSIALVSSEQTILATILNIGTGVSETYSYDSYKEPWSQIPQQLPKVTC